MKTILKKILTITTTASFALVPSVAILDLNAEADGSVDTSGEVRLLTQELDEAVDSTTDEVEGTVDDTLDTADDVILDEEREVNGETVIEMNAGERLVLVRADLIAEGGELEEEFTDPELVETESDLEAYATTLLINDENAKRIEVGESDVELTYRTHAKLFGFIPVLVSATATVNEDGETEVSYPWYAFLSSTNEAEIEADIEERLGMLEAAPESDEAGDSEATEEETTPEDDESVGEEEGADADDESDQAFTPAARALVLAQMYEAMQFSFENETGEIEEEGGAEADIEIEAEG
jgi:hypothetical protein